MCIESNCPALNPANGNAQPSPAVAEVIFKDNLGRAFHANLIHERGLSDTDTPVCQIQAA